MSSALRTNLPPIRRLPRTANLPVFAAVMLLCLQTVAFAQDRPLDKAIEFAMSPDWISKARSCQVGVVIYDPETGRVLGAANEEDSFIPASNMKLFSSGAALAVLGPDFEFQTKLLLERPEDRAAAAAAGLPSHQGLEGTHRLIVKADGDPALGDPELLAQMGLTAEQLLDVWVNAVRDSGIAEFHELIIDDRVFDHELVHPTWPTEQLNRWYCAPVSALNFHTNIVNVFAKPGSTGQPPIVTIEPRPRSLRLTNRATTVSKGRQTVWAGRRIGTNEMTLFGDVRYVSQPIPVTIDDPADFFGELLTDALRDAGITIKSVRRATDEEVVDAGLVLHTIRTPLATVLERTNRDSHNLYAEALLKRVAHELTSSPGSWINGSASLRMTVQPKLSLSPASALQIADGSGMSRENRVTPLVIAEWLGAMANDDAYRAPFIESLATPGDGTLRKRFLDFELNNQLHAKSGYLTGVSALSGYLVDPITGKQVIFSCLINNKPTGVPGTAVNRFYEEVMQIADKWLTAQSEAAVPALGG